MPSIQGYKARVKVGGTPVAMTDEATSVITANTVYQITNAAKRVFPLDAAIIVKVGGDPVSTGFTIDRLTGKIIFSTSSVRTVTVSGTYVPISVVTEANEFSVNLNAELIDTTRFVSSGYVEKTSGLKSAEGSISEFYDTNYIFEDKLTAGSDVFVEVDPDGSNSIIMFAKIVSSETSAGIKDAVTTSISFESVGNANISYI